MNRITVHRVQAPNRSPIAATWGFSKMRKPNWRLVITGIVMIVLAIAFFTGMSLMTVRSNDPVGLMQTVGQVSGSVGALGAAMAIFGFFIGRRAA